MTFMTFHFMCYTTLAFIVRITINTPTLFVQAPKSSRQQTKIQNILMLIYILNSQTLCIDIMIYVPDHLIFFIIVDIKVNGTFLILRLNEDDCVSL